MNVTTMTTTYLVAGMTCDHCVGVVREEIGRLGAVREVDVDLVPGGASRVTVTSTAPLVDAQVRAAVDEAGYAIVEELR
jgi:copper chaperone CopZ